MNDTHGWRPYRQMNLNETSFLPKNWLDQVMSVVSKHEYKTILDGQSVTSRELGTDVSIEVGIVSGDKIKENLPWLFELYIHQFRDFSSKVAGYPVYASADLGSSININILRGKQARYEWHVDSNPLTGLLFASTHAPGSGGELLFETDDSRALVYPESGKFIAFDARQIPHTVLPLLNDEIRISIPMNYYASPSDQSRPADLDGYLYTGAA